MKKSGKRRKLVVESLADLSSSQTISFMAGVLDGQQHLIEELQKEIASLKQEMSLLKRCAFEVDKG